MKRLLLNGSPRGKNSNSRAVIGWLVEGIVSAGAEEPVIVDMAVNDGIADAVEAFRATDEIILVFPLYTDSMPGIVAAFTNTLAELDPGQIRCKRIGYVVHSGFPETLQTEPLAAYLERMSARLGLVHLGTARTGGSEPFRLNPMSGRSRTSNLFRSVGRSLVQRGIFDPDTLAELAKFRRLGPGLQFLVKILAPTGLLNMYWNVLLKKHGAYDRRFDRPYAPAT